MQPPIPMSARERALAKSLGGFTLTEEERDALDGEPLLVARARNEVPGWDHPVPLDVVTELPAFPTDALPEPLAGFVCSVAHATQTPADLPGMMVLGALAAAAGGRAVAQPRAGWTEPLTLFLAIAMEPGNRKSAVVEKVTRPVRAAERAEIQRVTGDAAQKRVERDIAVVKANELKRKAARAAADPDSTDAADLAQQATAAAAMAEEIIVPTIPRILADDCTPEALSSIMAEQAGRVAVISAEGGIFDIIAGKYSKMPSFDVFLKGHAGDEIRVDRVGRKPEHIERPALTLALAVQPAVLKTITDREGFRGRGLLARFNFVIPTSYVGHREVGADPVPEDVRDAYDETMRALVLSLAEWTDPAVLVFTPQANAALLEYERNLEPKLGRGGELAHLADWGSKLAGATVRVAGLLHLAERLRTGYREPITEATYRAAIRIGDYFEAHAKAAHAFMGADPVLDDARAVHRWISGRKTFTKRDIHRALASRFPKSADIDPVLELLEDRGWIRRKPTPAPGPEGGRPRSDAFDVYPPHGADNRD